MTSRVRKLLPDAVLVLGVLCALTGAFFIHPVVALLVLGLLLIALAVWMGA